MVEWMQDYTVGDVAAIYADRLGEQPMEQYARRLRHILQQKVLAPRRRGDGRYARALFSKEDVLFTRLVLALADAGLSNERLAAVADCRDNIPDQPAGEEHDLGFACVLDGIGDGEDWFFNFHLSRSRPGWGGFARTAETAPKPIESFATITLPVTALLRPLLENKPVSRMDELNDLPAPPNMSGD